jgi:DNA mismatch repair protein MutS2
MAQGVLREWKTERVGRKQALKKLSEARERLEPANITPPHKDETPGLEWDALAPGARVAYKAWSKSGVVVEKDERKRQVKVDFSGVAMWVPFSELSGENTAARKAERQTTGGVSADLGFTPRIDLRGQRADEAISALGQFLDASLLRGATGVEIVHGRGTGALRKEVHAFLRTFPGVASFAIANEDRGGDGMTEAVLK